MKKHSVTSALCVLSVLMFATILASAQQPSNPPNILTHPEVNQPVQFDISRPLRDMATEVTPQVGFHLAPPVKYPHPELLGQSSQQEQPADGALQTVPGAPIAATLGLNLLGVGSGFPGYSVPDAPPDVNLAVGDTQILQWVNVSYAVFNKTTGAVVAGPIAGNAFWSGFGGGCQTANSGDPVILWDKIAHRWVVLQNVFSSPYMTCVAISTTADATGSYYRFGYSQPGFPDYPKWGVMPDAYYQSQNNFGSSGNSYAGARACAYDRTKMLAGDSSAAQICFQTGTADDSLLPADLDSAGTLPPSGQSEVFLGSIDASTSNVYKYLFHADFATPSNSTFTGTGRSMPIAVSSYSLACGGNGACIPQKGVTDKLDSLGDRLMFRLAYRNFSDHQTWLVSHSVTAGSSVGMRWYEFHAPEASTALSVYQQGTYAPDSSYRWMGSIAMDQSQDIALGYSVSSSTLYPSISYTGRVPTDALGTMESEASIVSGTGSQSDTSNRWGDYSSMVVDAADDCTFWYTQEYYTTTATFNWSTRLASLKFPTCGGSQQPDFSISASPSSVTVAQGGQGGSTITTSALNGFNNAIALTSAGAPTGTSVSFNPATIPAPGSGTSAMTITVGSSTTPGTYPITVTGTGGSTQHSTTVSLTVTGLTPDFTLTASPSSRTVRRGSATTYTATLGALNGFNSSVSLSVTGCPSRATCTFSPTSLTPPGSSTLTVSTTSRTGRGTYTLTLKGTGGSQTHSTNVSLTVN